MTQSRILLVSRGSTYHRKDKSWHSREDIRTFPSLDHDDDRGSLFLYRALFPYHDLDYHDLDYHDFLLHGYIFPFQLIYFYPVLPGVFLFLSPYLLVS